MVRNILAIAVIAMLALLTAGPVLADDTSATFHFTGTGAGVFQTTIHEDIEPFKGSALVTVFNDSNESWGAIHFEIFSVGFSVANVDFVDGGTLNPTSSQVLDSWAINNAPTTGSTMDLFFGSNPVAPGTSAWFKVYTDNTTDQKRFGLMTYPLPVPEPSSLLALSGSLVGLVGFAIRKKK
jgi:hypothetical protein